MYILSTSGNAFQFYKIRVGLSILFVCLLATLSTSQAKAVPGASSSSSASIVYPQAIFVPLDDRPSTHLFPAQIARIGGGNLVQPPANAIGKAYTPGDTQACAQWLLSQIKAQPKCTAIVSADMVAYGGLVASRTSVLSADQAIANLKVLEDAAQYSPQLEVYAMLPRLSLRTSDAQAQYETALANWAAKASYKKLQPSASVPAKLTEEYLAVRQRNVQVIEYLIGLAQKGVIKKLILGQDDANATGLHVEEQQRLRNIIDEQNAASRVTIVSGADELGMCLVAGWLSDYWHCHPSFTIIYSDPAASMEIPKLESMPLLNSVNNHLELCGSWNVDGMSADIQANSNVLWIASQSDKPFEAPQVAATVDDTERARKLDATLRWAKSAKRHIGVADVRLINRADPVLASAVLDIADLWDLEAYSAWNTPANTIGTAIAQMTVHEIARVAGRNWDQYHRLESEKTQIAFTWARLLDDYAYQALIRPTLTDMVKGLPRDPNPLLNKYGGAGMNARQSAIDWAEDVWQNKLKGRHYTHSNFGVPLVLDSYKLEVVLPWPRVFEIEARLDLRLSLMSAAEAKQYQDDEHAKNEQADLEKQAAQRAAVAAEAHRQSRLERKKSNDNEFKAAARARSAQPNKPKDRDQSFGEAMSDFFHGGETKEERQAKANKRNDVLKNPGKAIGDLIDTWKPVVKQVGPAIGRTANSVKDSLTEKEK